VADTKPTDDSQQTSTDGRQTVDTDDVSTDGQPAVVWMSRSDAAAKLKCTERTVDRRVESGKLQRRWGDNGAVEIGVPSSDSMSTDRRPSTGSRQTSVAERLSTDSDVSTDRRLPTDDGRQAVDTSEMSTDSQQTSTDGRQTVDMSTDSRQTDSPWRDDLLAQVARLEADKVEAHEEADRREGELREDVQCVKQEMGLRIEGAKARVVDLERAATVRESRIADMEATHADALATRDAELAELRGRVANLEAELRDSYSRAEANALGWANRADELSHRIADLVDKHQHANERVYELEPEAERVPMLVADIEDRDATLDAIASRVPAPVFRYLKRGKRRS
jgi:hypothetical protein